MSAKGLKVAVIGAGPGGQAIAAHMTLKGCSVNFYNRGKARLKPIIEKGCINILGAAEGTAYLNLVTNDIKKALDGVRLIVVCVPAFAHAEIANLCAPHLSTGQIVLLNPGRTCGAIEFANTLKELGNSEDVIIAETSTIMHTSRLVEQATVRVIALKRKVPVAAFPANKTGEVVEVLNKIFPQYKAASNVLETGLSNIGCILHPSPTLMNIGWIESPQTGFIYYYEGITPSVAQVLQILDTERLRVAEALGTEVPLARQWLDQAYGAKGNTLYEALQHNKFYQDIKAPKTIQHRYIWEDVPTGLVPIASLAELLGVDAPGINEIIDLACLVCSYDFRIFGRTVNKLGLDGMTSEQIQELVEKGPS